ncbi:MAG: hypothetical protein AAFQ51_18745, partial [Pseudomonadota bacterium]
IDDRVGQDPIQPVPRARIGMRHHSLMARVLDALLHTRDSSTEPMSPQQMQCELVAVVKVLPHDSRMDRAARWAIEKELAKLAALERGTKRVTRI